MDDLISRQAAIDALGEVMNWTDSEYELGQLNQWKSDRKAIIGLPSAQPERKREKRKHGHWHDRHYSGCMMIVCSECQHEYSYDSETGESDYNFCPNCGADMRGEEDE